MGWGSEGRGNFSKIRGKRGGGGGVDAGKRVGGTFFGGGGGVLNIYFEG